MAGCVATDDYKCFPQSSYNMRLAAYVARMGDRKSAYRVSVRRSEGKRQLGRARCRWKGNIGKNLQRIGMGRHGPDCSASG